MFFSKAVIEMLAVAGGLQNITTWSVIMEGGTECRNHGLPPLPRSAQGFGMTQAYDKLIFYCGGRSDTYTLSGKIHSSSFEIEIMLPQNVIYGYATNSLRRKKLYHCNKYAFHAAFNYLRCCDTRVFI